MSKKNLEFDISPEDIKILVSALMFSSSCDVTARFDNRINDRMIDLAENILKLNGEKIKFDLVEVFGKPKLYEQKEQSTRIKKLIKKYSK